LVAILVSLIIGFTVITVYSVYAMLVLRKRENEYKKAKDISKAIEDLDEALNAAINELNKMGSLIQAEVDEKYKAICFIYNLIDDKQKENGKLAVPKALPKMTLPKAVPKKKVTPKQEIQIDVDVTRDELAELGLPAKAKSPPKFANPKHKEIWELHESGKSVTDIAKEMGMGKGEVKLILNLVNM